MTENKRFTVHIKWFNYEKTEGEIELFDNGQPLLMSDCVEDVQMVKDLLNELSEENQRLKNDCGILIQSNQDYRAENEQLKQENYELHKRLGDFEPFEEHIKERTSKTSVNDIIGLVKTDEPTNSVELKKELYK